MGEGGAAPALPAQSGPAFPACSPGVPGQHSAGCRWRPACHQSPGGRAVVGCVLALLARLSASGQGGPQASSSGVPALPAEALALSITSIHLRGGAEVRAAPPTARLGGRVCLTLPPCWGHPVGKRWVTRHTSGEMQSLCRLKCEAMQEGAYVC